MGIASLFLLSIALAMDCFAVSIACAMQGRYGRKMIFRTAILFSGFHIVLISFGWWLGDILDSYVSVFDHWLAFGLLSAIGIKMILEAFDKKRENGFLLDSWSVLIGLCFATSMDAFVVGVGLSMGKGNFFATIACVGCLIFVMTLLAWFLGKRIRFFTPKWANIFGGLILITIGLKFLLEHEYGL